MNVSCLSTRKGEMSHRWIVPALFAVVVAISCDTRPELTRAHAADEIREWICSQEADLCPDSISTDLLRIRMEGNDLRHVDINGEHFVTYYWSGEVAYGVNSHDPTDEPSKSR